MEDKIDFILRIAALVVAIGAGIFGFLRWQIERRKSKPVFLRRTTHIVDNGSDKIDGIEISYKGEAVENVTITNVAIWNSGKKSLRSNDVPVTNKIRIAPKKKVNVFEINMLKILNEKNNFEVTTDEENHCYEILFDYMAYKDGIIVQLIHDGTSSSDIDVIGGTIDYGEIKNYDSSSKSQLIEEIFESKLTKLMPDQDEKRAFFLTTMLIGLGSVLIGLFMPHMVLSILVTIIGLAYLLISIFFRKFTSIPKGFEFMEE